MTLLKSSLSGQGYQKATAIIALEDILKVVEKRGPDDHYRDPMNYHLTIFGTPDVSKPCKCGVSKDIIFSLNFTLLNGTIVSSTPSFFGANPGIVKEGESKGLQVLKQETNLGFEFKECIFLWSTQDRPDFRNCACGNHYRKHPKKPVPLTPDGLSFKNMNVTQQKIMLQLLDVYIQNYVFGFSSKLMEKKSKKPELKIFPLHGPEA